jgi:hypothetical protein
VLHAGLDKFAENVALDDDGCWIWLGPTVHNGYGRICVNSKPSMAHRWAYEHFVGPIPQGLQIDHLCRVRACCNPDHLEPVTPLENTRRGQGNGSKTHCNYGHPFDDSNTVWIKDGARKPCRACRECRRAFGREWTRRHRAQLKRTGGAA